VLDQQKAMIKEIEDNIYVYHKMALI